MNTQFQHQRRSVRLVAHDYSSAGAYFATVCTEARGVNWFGEASGDGVLSPAGEMVRRELEGLPQRFTNLGIDEFIVMPDHVHVIYILHDDADTTTRKDELNVRPAEYHIASAAPHDDTDIPIRRGEPRVRPATYAARNPESDQLKASSRSPQSQGSLPANESIDSRVVPSDHVVHCTHGCDDRPYVHPSGTQFGSLGRIVQAFKSVMTVQYVLGVRESGWSPFEKRLWERNYWERVLRDNAELEVKRVHIAVFDAAVVPVGADQLPMIEQTREIVRKFNRLYGETLIEPEARVVDAARVRGLNGGAKMGKSLGNAVSLDDSSAAVACKVMSAMTDPLKLRLHDVGRPEVCTVFAYHELFNAANVATVAAECRVRTRGCVSCKRELSAQLDSFLEPIRARRSTLEPTATMRVLLEGTQRARRIARSTMARVKQAMKLDYELESL